ncbi:MAG: LacI family DNA-binding transcriptional regulator [Chloroflexi bacterium]|nr:LacI family DNA-binding transcriptional regulator [Chloroflexota bacterium]
MDHLTRRPTISDVAEAAGVSKTTVSFAFNRPDRLAAETATRIRSVADTLGYRPHPVARMLSQGRTGTIGVLTPQALAIVFENPYFGTFNAGVAAAAEAAGYALHFISPLQGSLARAVGRATVDGVVAVGLSADHPEVEQIRRAGLPMVLVDSTALPDQPSIEVDDEGGARLAAEHLLGLGHRAFVVLSIEPSERAGGEDPDGVPARRLRGYRAALAATGIALPDEAIVTSEATIPGGAASFAEAWDAGQRPTAVLAMSDATAVGAMRAARARGLRVPADLSVVGFDDVDLARFADPELTTIHQPIARKGEEAVRLLIAILGGAAGAPIHETLPTRLVARASTGPAPIDRRSAD